jgi:hypothetical protein
MRGFQPNLLVRAIRNAELAMRAHLRILHPGRSTFLLILVCAFLTSAQSEVKLTVDRSTIELGSSCRITWRSDGDSAFLIGVGKVPVSGSRSLQPEASTNYVLVVARHGVFSYANASVKVNGEKGGTPFPDPDEFNQEGNITDKEASRSYPDFLDIAFNTLQNKMAFSVRGSHLPGEDFFDFYTNRQIKPELIRPTDRGIRQRRVAYWMRVREPQKHGTVPFEIRASVEYQRFGESEWRMEKETQLKRDAAELLRSAISDVVK